MVALPFDESELSGCTEVSREEMFSNFLTDDSLNDFSLEGIDGVKVRANRRVLASRSDVFHKMLLGGFSEASSPGVKIGYSGIVVKAVVEYIHTDTAQILNFTKEGGNDVGLQDTVHIQALVSLAGAAAYFNLPGLCRKTYDCVSALLQKRSSLSWAVLEACSNEGPSVPNQFGSLAVSQLDSDAFISTNTSALARVSAPTLHVVLQNNKTRADEYQLFKILQLWKDAVETRPSVEAGAGTDRSLSVPDRRAVASDLVKCIHLEWIDPEILSTSVASSGLVEKKQLLEAYKKQALFSKEQYGVCFKKCRNMPEYVWADSKTDVSSNSSKSSLRVDLLECPPMSRGIFQWTIKFEVNRSSSTFLGVASTKHSINKDAWLVVQNGGWAYGDIGSTFHHGKNLDVGLPKYFEGDEVTFTLNLTQENSGTLTASINGATSFQLFSGMSAGASGQYGGFVPAVSLLFPASIRLLEFKQLSK